MIITSRDNSIVNTVAKFKIIQGRQIKALCGFAGTRACDRRLKALTDNGFLNRQRVIYGVAGLYTITPKAVKEFGIELPISVIRLDQVRHDIAVVDTVTYYTQNGISLNDITTEKELRHKQGFGNREHMPDFVFPLDGKSVCVEVELSLKAKDRLVKNLKANYLKYDTQIWVIPEEGKKIREIVSSSVNQFPNIEMLSLSQILGTQN